MAVEKQKGFQVEYCNINDEYIATLKNTTFMGAGNTIEEAISDLEADVQRGEQTEEAARHSDGVECQGDGTEKIFIIMDADVLRLMRNALYNKEVHASIAAGIEDMEAGRMMTVQEAEERVRAQRDLPGPQ